MEKIIKFKKMRKVRIKKMWEKGGGENIAIEKISEKVFNFEKIDEKTR